MNPVDVLYASETGTAEDVAIRTFRLLCRSGLTCRISALDDSNLFDLAQSSGPSEARKNTLVFIVSTTGDGKPPFNMQNFWKSILRKKIGIDYFQDVPFAVFGLGDSSYEKYNAAARMLRKRLLQLGAVEVIPIGLGDDQAQHSFLDALDSWTQQLLQHLVPGAQPDLAPVLYPEDYVVVATDGPVEPRPEPCSADRVFSRFRRYFGVDMKGPFGATVSSCARLTEPSWAQNVSHIKFKVDITDGRMLYRAGDVSVIHPENSSDLVRRALAASGLKASVLLDVRRVGLPCRGRIGDVSCTAVELLKYHLDIAGIPQRGFFELLSFFSNDDEEKEKLLEISSGPGTDLYFDYCVREKRNYVDVLEDFKSCRGRVPLTRLLDVIPVLKPRRYSIASAPSEAPDEIELCVALVEERTRHGRTRLGTCSQFLCALTPRATVYMWIDHCSELSRNEWGPSPPPAICRPPMLLIGPGTGIAPMRSCLRERLHHRSRSDSEAFGSTILFFGCRRSDADYLYQSEWNALAEQFSTPDKPCVVTLSEISCSGFVMHTAFSKQSSQDLSGDASREDANRAPGGGLYVTHLLRRHGKLVWDTVLSREGCVVYVAGSAKKMPADVRACLRDIIFEHGGAHTGVGSVDAAEHFLKSLESSHRYVLDVWS